MTNPAVPLGVADDQGPLCPYFALCIVNPLTEPIAIVGLVALGNSAMPLSF